MVNVHGVARLGVLAVGLGIGVGWAHMPVASADSSGDWLSSIDSLLSGASPAEATPLDLGISFDGYNIYTCDCGTVAGTAPGEYGLAIAYGDNASAFAGGPGGLAVAGGSGAAAFSNGGTGDVAEAVGINADADAGAAGQGLVGADYDTAIDIGNNSIAPNVGGNQGAYAGYSNLNGGTDGGTGVHDTAIDIGNNSGGISEGDSGYDGAFAGAGGLGGREARGTVTTTPPSTSATTPASMTAPKPSTATVTTPASPAAPPVTTSTPMRARATTTPPSAPATTPPSARSTATTTTPTTTAPPTAPRWPNTAIPTSPTSWTPSVPRARPTARSPVALATIWPKCCSRTAAPPLTQPPCCTTSSRCSVTSPVRSKATRD